MSNYTWPANIQNALTGQKQLPLHMAGGLVPGIMASPSPIVKLQMRKTKSAYQKAALSLREGRATITDVFFKAEVNEVLERMGHLRPVHNGRPQAWAAMFLNAGNFTSSRSKTASMWYNYLYRHGLFYKRPLIPMRAKQRYRLTTVGLALLDHWAKKNPIFLPFLNAYITPKMRKEIAADCFLMEIGQVPPAIDKVREQAAIWLEKARQLSAAQQEEKMRAAVFVQQQQLLASQVYQNGLNNLGAQPNIWATNTSATQPSNPSLVNTFNNLFRRSK